MLTGETSAGPSLANEPASGQAPETTAARWRWSELEATPDPLSVMLKMRVVAVPDGLVVAGVGLVQATEGAAVSGVRVIEAASPLEPVPFVALTEKVAAAAPALQE
jgi:hypothetical protein